MATQKPTSTISYNSEAFLKEKLDLWVKQHIIQTYQYICHKGEDGDKDHIHVRIEPNKKLDVMDLQEQLREFQFGKDKPLGCRPFRPSKEEDWILYVVHDKEYLALKYGGGEKGEKIPYDWHEIKAPENYDVEIAYIRAKATLKHTSVNMATRMQMGEKPLNLVLEGENVYMVNAIMRSLQSNDYQRLQERFNQLSAQFDALVNAVYDYGLDIEPDSKGNPKLVKAKASRPEKEADTVKKLEKRRKAKENEQLELKLEKENPFK